MSEQDLVPFLKDIYLSFRELALQKEINYQISTPAPLYLWFDAYQLQKVFFNLISNAFKYTHKGGSIDIVIKEEEAGAVIQVIDNGIGLTPEESERIFDLFYQVKDGISSPALSSGQESD